MIFPDPISVYIHFPFCLSKCFYCDFYSEDRTVKKTDKYLKALSTEIRNWHNRMGMTQPGSIYIGGGSPSLMTETQWEILSMTIKEAFSIRDECEYTIECNPETYSLKKAVCWRDTGVNRLSLGIQSLNPDLLKRIGRPHTEKESLDILENLKENPLFTNVSVDLMYGLPGQTTTDINRDTSALIHNYPFIKHFSVYELEMKDNTKIMRYLNSHLMPDEEDLIEMNRAVSESLRKEGFKRYEVSNYSRPGFESKHNSAYWSMKPYIGFGPSACSFLDNTRWKNLPDTDQYIRDINSGNDIRGIREYTEEITRDMAETEILFTGLRTSSGIILEEFRKRCGKDLISGKRAGIVSELIDKGYADVDSTRLRLTETGMDMADGITSRLISVSE